MKRLRTRYRVLVLYLYRCGNSDDDRFELNGLRRLPDEAVHTPPLVPEDGHVEGGLRVLYRPPRRCRNVLY